MTSEGNSALLPANVDWRLPLQRGLMNFQLQNFQLYNKSLNDWSWKRLILSQSLCVYYYHYCYSVIYSWRVFLTALQNLRSILCLVSAFTPYTKCPCRVMNRHSIETWKSCPASSSLNSFPSQQSAATDDRKHFQWLNIVLNNKTGPLLLKFYWCPDKF